MTSAISARKVPVGHKHDLAQGASPARLAQMSINTWPPFDNAVVRSLPFDTSGAIGTRSVMKACGSLVSPTPVSKPRMLAWIPEVAKLLGLPALPGQAWTDVLCGNQILPGMEPYAACYGGHQFGNWAGQLGDGRAITLGEVIAPDGKRFELQLKGAGPTPYSRNADGRAVLRSSLRELICSEAMHHLGIPTTRALSLVATGDLVMRDMFYNGNARHEHGAITARVSPSFIRFGNFELHSARGDHELLRKLTDFTINEYFSTGTSAILGSADYLAFFYQVALRTAHMVIEWMRVGFVHGVMNTDNMSILGLTIDYGPYGWLEPYDPRWTPNTTDADGRRYAFGAQPMVAQWNIAQLARALRPLINNDVALADGVDMFWREYNAGYRRMMLSKLGVDAVGRVDDDELIAELLGVFSVAEIDFTLFFRQLAKVSTVPGAGFEPLREAFYDPAAMDGPARLALTAWMETWFARARDSHPSDALRATSMNAVNPLYVPRNYLAQQAIEALEKDDVSVLHKLLAVGKHPYMESPDCEALAGKRPDWARHKAGCSMLSCSS
jgi:serine/tyrosine/threonine adenylyltransferase